MGETYPLIIALMEKATNLMGTFYMPLLMWVRIIDGVKAGTGLTKQICDYSIDNTGLIQYRLKPIGMRVKQMDLLWFINVERDFFEITSSETIISYNGVILDDQTTLSNDPEIQWIEEMKINGSKKRLNTCSHLMITYAYRNNAIYV